MTKEAWADKKQVYAAVKESIKNPYLVYIVCSLFIIIVSGAILFMVLVGMIRIDNESEKQVWIEVNSQILNFFFTIQAIIDQPKRLQLLIWTIVMKLDPYYYSANIHSYMPDILLLPSQREDSSQSASSPSSPTQMVHVEEEVRSSFVPPLFPFSKWVFLIVLLNLQCFFQYPITIAMWGWATNPLDRPKLIIPICLPLSFLSGAAGGIWLLMINLQNKKLAQVQTQ
ncbi:hypothetical protein EDD86DRAFT_46230 [Gorgonomyces haynaldii]|nr:hypothetical protein EDD86DRAFT_46230 [Gorgonomyces haynaldii]